MSGTLLAYVRNLVGICQEPCWHMSTTLLAYGSNPTNLIPQTNRYVIYKHKIYLFQAYYLQRINRISY
jgi:hypothetical protein